MTQKELNELLCDMSLDEKIGQLVQVPGSCYEEGTLAYLRQLAWVNRRMAAIADNVCEVACGIPAYYKGKEPVG